MEATTLDIGRDTPVALLHLSPADINGLGWQRVSGCPGVKAKQLWRSGDHVDALISYTPGARTPGHPHASADHHIWITGGRATIAGRLMVEGSYVYIPSGTAHPIEAVGPEGCVLLQMHRPRADRG